MLKEQINDSREIQKFFPFLFAIFTFILFANFLGLIPFNFTVTSHLLVTFNLSFMVFIGITIIGILINKEKFILLFIPANVPKYLLDFLFIIELVSYISRTFSLAIRLFANMLSGHALMFILSGFISKTYKVFNFAFELRFLIIFVVMAVSVLEMGICFLQAYVFTILTIIYLNDSFNVSH
jgi:F-type H+-transporting ATPase subunit a